LQIRKKAIIIIINTTNIYIITQSHGDVIIIVIL